MTMAKSLDLSICSYYIKIDLYMSALITVCLRSLVHFIIASNYKKKMETTSWTYSTLQFQETRAA